MELKCLVHAVSEEAHYSRSALRFSVAGVKPGIKKPPSAVPSYDHDGLFQQRRNNDAPPTNHNYYLMSEERAQKAQFGQCAAGPSSGGFDLAFLLLRGPHA